MRSAMRPCQVALVFACSSLMRGALSASPALSAASSTRAASSRNTASATACGGVVADQARIGPERHLRKEMRTLAVARLGREAQRRERHHVGRDEAADRLDLAAALVDLL